MNDNNVETTEPTANLDKLFAVLTKKQEAIQEATQAYEDHLLELAAQAGKTFEYDGQYYQISSRTTKDKHTGEVKNKVVFLKKLPSAPKAWLKGRPKTKKADLAAALNQAVNSTERMATEPSVTDSLITDRGDEFVFFPDEVDNEPVVID